MKNENRKSKTAEIRKGIRKEKEIRNQKSERERKSEIRKKTKIGKRERENLPSVAERVGEREKRESGREKKRESGREKDERRLLM